jgi:hypothetical protein
MKISIFHIKQKNKNEKTQRNRTMKKKFLLAWVTAHN